MEKLKTIEELLNGEYVEEAKKFLLVSYVFEISPEDSKEEKRRKQNSWIKFLYNKLDDGVRPKLFEKLEEAGLVGYDKLTDRGRRYAEDFSYEMLHQKFEGRGELIEFVEKRHPEYFT